jgi:hypothetical protein
MKKHFIPGLELSRRFYSQVVRPLLDRRLPALPHSAALIGVGSEVLGFDTSRSTDHDWGPRVLLFISEEAYAKDQEGLLEYFQRNLPTSFETFPLSPLSQTHPFQPVEIHSPRQYFQNYLGFDILKELEAADWLSLPEQKLLTITSGAVFWDEVGLESIRERFKYYPHEIWIYLLASAWNRIGQEEHLLGRAGESGDEIGSAIIASRLVRDLMRLAFLIEKRYAPYPKWFGRAFSHLNCAAGLSPLLQQVLASKTWEERQERLAAAYEIMAAMHNRLALTEPLDEKTTNFYDRPFRVIWGGRFAEALKRRITDPALKRLAEKSLIGSIDQFSDSTDLLTDSNWRSVLRNLYK